MVKAILAIFGLNFLYEHPYITLLIVIIIIGAGYSYLEQKREEEANKNVQVQNPQPIENNLPEESQNPIINTDNKPKISKKMQELIDLTQQLRDTDENNQKLDNNASETEKLVFSLLSEDRKLSSFNKRQRAEIYDYHKYLSQKLNSDSIDDEQKFGFKFICVGIQEKVKEFYKETDLSEMTRNERIEFLYSIDFLKKKIHERQADAEMYKNYILLIKNMAKYILNVLNKEEATIYMDLMEKEAKEGLSQTEARILKVLDGKIRNSLQND